MFNKEVKKEIEELKNEVEKLKCHSRITFKDENAMFGYTTIGVSDILVELLDSLGYELKRKNTNIKIRCLNKK